MSYQATSWAVRQQTGNSGRKCVLLVLANHANPNGICFPGRKTLAEECECGEPTITSHIAWLQDKGFLARVERRRENRSRTTDWVVLAPNADDRGEMKDAIREEYPEAVAELARSGSDSQPEEQDRLGISQGQVGILGGPEEVKEQNNNSLARPREVLDLDQLQGNERRVVEILRFVASEKAADLNEKRVLQILKDYPDRDHVGEVEKFEHWHLQGKGQNVQRRNLTTAWRNWLDQASPLEEKSRQSSYSSWQRSAVGGARRRPSNEQEVAERLYPGDADAAKAVRGALSWGAATDDGVREWIKEWRPDIHERWSA